ncbi:MAG: pilus assembly protein TadG-related protein [Actinomycetes bacterium]
MTHLARLRRDDEGQLLLLVLCYAVIAGLLVTVVVNLSKAYLYRRSLVAAADGAALSAANQPDLAGVYSGRGPALPISQPGAVAAVDQYAADARLGERFDGFEVVDVQARGQTVSVTLRAVAGMPFLNLVSARYDAGYPVDATATARSPLVAP